MNLLGRAMTYSKATRRAKPALEPAIMAGLAIPVGILVDVLFSLSTDDAVLFPGVIIAVGMLAMGRHLAGDSVTNMVLRVLGAIGLLACVLVTDVFFGAFLVIPLAMPSPWGWLAFAVVIAGIVAVDVGDGATADHLTYPPTPTTTSVGGIHGQRCEGFQHERRGCDDTHGEERPTPFVDTETPTSVATLFVAPVAAGATSHYVATPKGRARALPTVTSVLAVPIGIVVLYFLPSSSNHGSGISSDSRLGRDSCSRSAD